MFELIFLGTSASVPSAERNHPGLLITFGAQRVLVDCGEGTQRQLLKAGVGFRRLHRLLLTHDHFDHLLGIPGLVATLGLYQNAETMVINGGPRTLQVVANVLRGFWSDSHAPIPLELAPLSAAQRIAMDGFTITCVPVQHRDTDSFGFIFETANRRHLRPDRLVEFAIPDGPIRGRLAQGLPATLPNGETIDPETVLGPPEGSRKVVIVGDAETTNGLEGFAQGADLLIIESTFLERDAAIARDYGHLTAAQAARLAKFSDVKQLILTHISGRYEAEEVLAEAREIFTNTQVAADLLRIAV
jgi:ribonuclease Z